jgi:hypothetical protein
MSDRYRYANEFYFIFGVYLKDYWDKLTGFDSLAFDKFIDPPDNVSLHDHILSEYGERAVFIIRQLTSCMPLLERLGGNHE